MAGNITMRPDGAGWREAPLNLATRAPTNRHAIDYYYLSAPLGDLTLVVGEAMDRIFDPAHDVPRLGLVWFHCGADDAGCGLCPQPQEPSQA